MASPVTFDAAEKVSKGTFRSTGVPAAPIISSVTAGDGQLTINWGSVGLATSYKVYYNTSDSFSGASAFSGNPVSALTATITGLTNTTQYYIFVVATNAQGDSAESSSDTGTPSAAGGSATYSVVGSTLVIDSNGSGINFGSDASPLPLVFWRGSDGLSASSTYSRSPSAIAMSPGAISTSLSGDGQSQSVYIDHNTNSGALLGMLEYSSGLDEYYQCRRCYSNFSMPQGVNINNKVFRMWSDVGGGNSNVYVHQGQNFVTQNGLRYCEYVGETPDYIDDDEFRHVATTWNNEEFYFKEGSLDTEDAELWWWFRGKLKWQNTPFMQRTTSISEKYKEVYQFQVSNGTPSSAERYIDYLYASEKIFRVMLADTDTLNLSADSDTGYTALALPITSRSSDEIIVADFRDHLSGATHLIVVDDSNTQLCAIAL